ncbi:MAG: hypothetical protein QXS20_00255 [Candidatus Thorarchaeota archaeon]
MSVKEPEHRCDWCGAEVSQFRYKNGRKVYCSGKCWSAGMYPLFLPLFVFLVSFDVLIMLFPSQVVYMFLRYQGYNGPLPSELNLALFTVIAQISLLVLMTLWTGNEVWIGRKVRREVRQHTDNLTSHQI